MQVALTYLVERVPVTRSEDGSPILGEDGAPVLRWLNTDGHIMESSAGYVAEKFGAAIERALADGTDVLDAVLASDFDAGWKDIWRRWRELGFI